MTVYNISGTTLSIDGDSGSGTLTLANSISPITGGMGVNTVRILNDGSNNANVTFTPTDVTYSFANVSGSASGLGANATFTVTVSNSGYDVAILNAGSGYANLETITILGDDLGGTSTANDLELTLTVGTVANVAGVVTSVAKSGTALWPQSTTGEFTMLPNSIEFVQVTNTPSVGCYFTANTGDTGNVFVTPVAIVG